MPAKNSQKSYQDNSYYHIYNRGVDKRRIFTSEKDYAVFLSYLKEYLLPKDLDVLRSKIQDPQTSYKAKDKLIKMLRMNNFSEEIELHAYCIMPNHYHLLIKQHHSGAIDSFMNSLAARYTMYFNKSHHRTGTLYGGVYKAVLVSSDEQFIHLSRYIHRNPFKLASQGLPLQGQPSSLSNYYGLYHTPWLRTETILSYFSKNNPQLTYQAFIEQPSDTSIIQDVLIDNE